MKSQDELGLLKVCIVCESVYFHRRKEKKNSSPTGLYCQWRGKRNSPDSMMNFAYSGIDIYVRSSNTQDGNL